MTLTIEMVKTIASLCMISAGDHNSMSSVVSQVENSQSKCHAYYADCFSPDKSFSECMKLRPLKLNEEFRRLIKGEK